jgi:hypothetical protein
VRRRKEWDVIRGGGGYLEHPFEGLELLLQSFGLLFLGLAVGDVDLDL